MICSSVRTMRSAGRKKSLNSKSFRVKVVNDIQKPDRSLVPKLVVHKIHRPYLFSIFRHAQFLRFIAHEAFSGLDAQVQLHLSVNSIHALMVPGIPFYIEQIEKTETKSPVARRLRQPKEKLSNQAVFVRKLAFITIAAFIDLTCRASL